jgi:adenylate cyclase
MGGGIGALLTVGAGLILLLSNNLGEKLIHLSYDLPFRRRPAQRPDELVIVYMDDASHEQLRQPYTDAWDRGLHARLLERLTEEHARAVGFDVLFGSPNPDHPEGDERFERALKANGKVVLGADYEPSQDGSNMMLSGVSPVFSNAAAGLGMVNMPVDQDFIVRMHLHVPFEKGYEAYSSLSWRLAELAKAQVAKDPNQRYLKRWFNYYGPLDTVSAVSFLSALQTNEVCPAGFFFDKVVLIGGNVKIRFSGERKDELRTPYTQGSEFVAAVDVQATQTLNLLRGDWLTRPSTMIEIIIVALAGLLVGYVLTLLRPLSAIGFAIGAALLVGLLAHFLFIQQRLWFPWLIIVAAQIPVALVWAVALNSVQLYVQNRLYELTLHMYLSPKLVKKFSSNKELLKPGARKQRLTVLFSDIAGFTSLSEGMDSDELARVMNNYFGTAVSQCIHATDGTVVKYLGDSIFAFWNAPDLQSDHELRACEAALRFRGLPAQRINGHPLETRLGLHTGVANVGNFGSPDRVDYTAVGESINLASRMEGLNKYLGTKILITAETNQGLAGRLLTRFLGSFRLKGFEKSVKVYELVGSLDQAEARRSQHEVFAQGLSFFQEKDFTMALAAFREALEINPGDGPTQFYLKSISEMRDRPLPSDWRGETEFTEK